MHFSNTLTTWYSKNKRDLPWRKTTSPYHVWLSEIILQQTRVVQGMSYYEKFVNHYPSITDLAKASEDEVLKLWQGLGYYSRARNLHATAKYISSDLSGVFPTTFNEIIKLKGVGDYTGAAIASFCFNEPVAVVDGNVYRVLSRFYDLETPIDSSKGKKEFQKLANEVLNSAEPADHNQAIMEFGALQCTPSPDCSMCPLNARCEALAKNKVEHLPVKSKKIKVRKRYFNFIVISDGENTLIEKRVEKDIWQNLFQFPLEESSKLYSSPSEIKNKIIREAQFLRVSDEFKHVLSHQVLFAKFWVFKVKSLADSEIYQKIKQKNIQEYAVPRLIDKYLEKDS